MRKGAKLYSGKAKSLYATDDDDVLVVQFRDDATAFDGQKKASLARKGLVNNHFNAFIMQHLAEAGIATHFVELLTDTESVVKKLDMIGVECVVRNIASGSLCRRYGTTEGIELAPPVFEFFLKNDALHDPLINESHITTFNWATEQDVAFMKKVTLQINEVLCTLFTAANLLLVDFKLEFGRHQGELLLGDEITPDGCRIWDADTRERLDKDRFRQDLGDVIAGYEQVAKRLGIALPASA